MRKNVTFIDDLFDADSLTAGNQIVQNERDDYLGQVSKRHIRNHNNDYSSAMNGGNIQPNLNQPNPNQFNMNQFNPNQFNPNQFNPNQFMNMQPDQYYYKNSDPEPKYYSEPDLSCMTIANHIKDCPICSKFYNSDNSIYIVCIVLLIIVCIILLKRIIEKN